MVGKKQVEKKQNKKWMILSAVIAVVVILLIVGVRLLNPTSVGEPTEAELAEQAEIEQQAEFDAEVKAIEDKLVSDLDSLVGTEFDDFTLTDIEGDEINYSDMERKNRVFVYMATWSEPSLEVLSEFEDYNENYDGVELTGVFITGMGEEDSEFAEVYSEYGDRGVDYYTSGDSIVTKLASDAYTIPLLVFVDSDGIIQEVPEGHLPAELIDTVATQVFE